VATNPATRIQPAPVQARVRFVIEWTAVDRGGGTGDAPRRACCAMLPLRCDPVGFVSADSLKLPLYRPFFGSSERVAKLYCAFLGKWTAVSV
jgi:hypothetical protein